MICAVSVAFSSVQNLSSWSRLEYIFKRSLIGRKDGGLRIGRSLSGPGLVLP